LYRRAEKNARLTGRVYDLDPLPWLMEIRQLSKP